MGLIDGFYERDGDSYKRGWFIASVVAGGFLYSFAFTLTSMLLSGGDGFFYNAGLSGLLSFVVLIFVGRSVCEDTRYGGGKTRMSAIECGGIVLGAVVVGAVLAVLVYQEILPAALTNLLFIPVVL